jgi:hypothetical protein
LEKCKFLIKKKSKVKKIREFMNDYLKEQEKENKKDMIKFQEKSLIPIQKWQKNLLKVKDITTNRCR